MDDCRFDNWTRMVAGKSDRRTAVKGFAGAAAALLTLAGAELGLAQGAGLERNCNVNGAGCRREKDCCSLKCGKKKRRSRNGTCQCAGQSARCQRDNGCCSGICRSGNCDCGNQSDFCLNDSDCCSRRCESGACRCGKRGDRCNSGRACCSNSCGADGFCL